MLPTIAVGADVPVTALDRGPTRGLVVRFRAPERPENQFVKRIVALPGDTVSLRGTEVVVNGAPVPRCFIGAWTYSDDGGRERTGEVWLEALDEAKWLVFHEQSAKALPTGPWTVAPQEVFVLGDNRENSHDSRVWFGGKGGGLPLSLIVGAATSASVPALPKGADGLKASLDKCIASLSKERAGSTSPTLIGSRGQTLRRP